MGDRLDRGRWRDLADRLGIAPDDATFARLQDAYAEPHRRYHTAEHIAHCLAELDEVRHMAGDAAEIEVALWFHDAVYDTHAGNNEAKSALWVATFLLHHDAAPARIGRVHYLIMATQHAATPLEPDAMLLVDVDLSILGADEATYHRFEVAVRQEYDWVPDAVFNETRARILQSFLDRPTIYGTPPFRGRLEAVARRNLREAIASLTQRA